MDRTESPAIQIRPDVVAKAGTYYRNARYLICLMMLGGGLWFGYDGFVGWPAEQARFNALSPSQQSMMQHPHTDTDIGLQRRLAYGLVPLSVIAFAFFMYRSRGVYRLSGNTLYVPGHPPVDLESITALDKSKWERKGIAFVDYTLSAGTKGRLTLDDFVYQREPTDRIVEEIEKHLDPEGMRTNDAPDTNNPPAPAPR